MNNTTSRKAKRADPRRSEIEDLCATFPGLQNTRKLLDAVVQGAASFFAADAATAFLLQRGALVPAAWMGLQPQPLEQNAPPVPKGLRAYVARFLAPGECRHFMHAPIVGKTGILGELAICSSRRDRASYTSEDRALLALLARRAGAALGQVRTLERAERQRGSLARIAKNLVRETELRHVAVTAVELAVSELEADAAAVWLATPEERSLALLAATGFSQDSLDTMMRLDFDSPTLASRCASTQQIQVLDSLDQAAEYGLTKSIMEQSGILSLVDVPLIAHDRLVGVFTFARKTDSDWAEGERVLVGTMADLLASALLNARLYEESERRRLLAENLTSTLTTVNEELASANNRTGQLADLAQQRAVELEATIANIADAVFVCDTRGKIVLINDAGLEILGSPPGEDLPTLRDYLAAARLKLPDGRTVDPEELAITRALRGEVVRGVQEMIYDVKNGKDRYIMVSAAPIRDRKGNLLGAVEVQSDITKMKELDILKDQFITVAAHEIKTPVTAIKGFAQTLLRSKADFDPKHKNALETIVRQSDRIDALVRDFLEISRMRREQSGLSAERLSLTELVNDVVTHMARGTERHSIFVSRSDEVNVDGERERLQEVVMNLLDNAMRYSPSGGNVEVRIAREGDRAVVSVRDEGMGIPETRQANLFERFYRAHIGTSLDYGGLGVGLYISREIVRRHGGEMWFESQEGKGSTFYFTIPLAAASIGDRG